MVSKLTTQREVDLHRSLQDVLNRFKSCLGAGDGKIEGDENAIAQAEALLNYQPLPALCLTKGKHTPGPWQTASWENIAVNDSNGNTIVACPQGAAHSSLDEIKANARLIAAAPDLLEALVAMVEWFVDSDQFSDLEHLETVKSARAAITKAEGE